MKKYRCKSCGYITDEEIKEDFLCPLCGVNKEYFEEIIVLDEEEKPKSIPVDEDNPSIQRIVKRCINCGRCVEVCPSRLIPSRLADYAEHHDEEAFTKHNLDITKYNIVQTRTPNLFNGEYLHIPAGDMLHYINWENLNGMTMYVVQKLVKTVNALNEEIDKLKIKIGGN